MNSNSATFLGVMFSILTWLYAAIASSSGQLTPLSFTQRIPISAELDRKPNQHLVSFVVTQQEADDSTRAHVVIRLPADAELEVLGKKIPGSGELRRIHSPPLEPNKSYSYLIKASWLKDGQSKSDERKVSVQAGITVEIELGGSTTGTAEDLAVLALVNAERAKIGAQPLTLNLVLSQVARAHSENMARQNVLSHDLDGKQFWQRIDEAGYLQGESGENCAEGTGQNPVQVMEMWMHSEGHRGNILNPNYKEMGIGVGTAQTGKRYWTQVFAVPATR